MEPIAEGTASVTVTATDLAGESAQSVLTVQVGSVPAGDGGLLIAPNPVGETLSMHFAAAAGVGAEAVIYDAAARRVLSEMWNSMGTERGRSTCRHLLRVSIRYR